jgi:hypothetical protein
MPRILDNRDTHVLVLEDGETKLIPWSDFNTLVYKHGLHGLLVARDEILHLRGPPTVEIAPDGDEGFSITVSNNDHEYQVRVPQHETRQMLDALVDVYDDSDRDPEPLVELVDDQLGFDVNPNIVDTLADTRPFDDAVAVTKDGWLIHDHVLLTYDNEFYHPNQQAFTRNGEVVDEASDTHAYEVRFRQRPDGEGQLNLTGFAGLGNEDEMVDFVARALWAVTYTPEQ